jgi:ATP-dependent protease HslVU (ClpYQ) peptidase subunit
MSALEFEVVEAFQSIGVGPELAMKAAMALHKHDRVVDQAMAKRDVQIASLVTDMSVMKWMMGVLLTLVVAVLVKLLIY